MSTQRSVALRVSCVARRHSFATLVKERKLWSKTETHCFGRHNFCVAEDKNVRLSAWPRSRQGWNQPRWWSSASRFTNCDYAACVAVFVTARQTDVIECWKVCILMPMCVSINPKNNRERPWDRDLASILLATMLDFVDFAMNELVTDSTSVLFVSRRARFPTWVNENLI